MASRNSRAGTRPGGPGRVPRGDGAPGTDAGAPVRQTAPAVGTFTAPAETMPGGDSLAKRRYPDLSGGAPQAESTAITQS